jgi:hypothetical protein
LAGREPGSPATSRTCFARPVLAFLVMVHRTRRWHPGVVWFLAKKLSSLDQLNFPASFIRREWKPFSTSHLGGLTSSTSKLSELRRFSPYATSVRSTMRLPATRSTRKREESNHPGMNTCTKIGGGYPRRRRAVLAFRVARRVRYSSAASLEKAAIRSGSPSRATNGSVGSLRTCRSSTAVGFWPGRVRPKYR